MIAIPQKRPVLTVTPTAAKKEKNLRGLMRRMETVLVAYSGGVDSAYLALIATQELGNRATCITGLSPSVSEFQRAEAVKIAVGFDLNFETI
ncbi:MAG: hypothetical protein H7070_14140, partial [Saprospiraceae bacterium]|nr:hypothetical protein [Pyrinomonadaceae bacterium]